MAMQAHEIEDLIRATFPDAKISIEDLRGMVTIIPVWWKVQRLRGKHVFSSIRWSIIRWAVVWVDSYMRLPCRQGCQKSN